MDKWTKRPQNPHYDCDQVASFILRAIITARRHSLHVIFFQLFEVLADSNRP